MSRRSDKKYKTIPPFIIAIVAVVGLIAGAFTAYQYHTHVREQQEREAAQIRVAQYTQALKEDQAFFTTARAHAIQVAHQVQREERLTALSVTLETSTQVLEQVKDQVLDQTSVQALQEAKSRVENTVDSMSPWALRQNTEILNGYVTAVQEAHAQWVAHQEELRRIEEQKRQEELRKQQETAAAAAKSKSRTKSSSSSASAAPVTSGPNVYSRHVWATGHQDEIDQCRGAVLSDYGTDGISIGEHNHCGGAYVLKLKSGDIVQLSGVLSGDFLVTGSKSIKKGARSTELEGGLWLQTCYYGSEDMRLVRLQRL